ncbi:MAG: VWA domain-containing protein [Vicinamibacterales bacterium]
MHGAAQEPDGTVFRAASDLVLVPANVTDDRGRSVPGLTRQDFVLKEDGKPRPIANLTAERTPISVGILMDASGSMTGERLAMARFAIEQFVSGLERDDEVFLQTFSNRSTVIMPWTRDLATTSAALDRIAAGGGTALFRAVSDAYALLKRGRNTRRALILLSDGNDNEFSGTTLAWGNVPHRTGASSTFNNPQALRRLQLALQEAQRSAATLYAVGIAGNPRDGDAPLDVAKLRQLTDSTGGYTEVVTSPLSVPGAMVRIGDDLRAQYLIGYQSAITNPDGKAHKIELTTEDRRYRVRARSVFISSR